jgi:hypothetical protein
MQRSWKISVVLIFAAALNALVYPGLEKRYRSEHSPHAGAALIRPRIMLSGQDAFHVKRVALGGHDTDVLSIRIVNEPESSAAGAIAHALHADFTCEGAGVLLPWIRARNDYSTQPGHLAQGQLPELVADLVIDDWREFNLIIKNPESDYCYLFNNDSFRYPGGENPAWKIGKGKYRVAVKISAVEVRERFECVFVNPGRGASLKVQPFNAGQPAVQAPTRTSQPASAVEGDTKREWMRVDTILRDLRPEHWRILALLAHERSASLPLTDIAVLYLMDVGLIESLGAGRRSMMEEVFHVHPDAKAVIADAIGRGRHLPR